MQRKIPQDQKTISEISRGIVRWLVEMIDEANEQVGIATILTMVRLRDNGL